MRPVHTAEKTVESHHDKDENDCGDQVSNDAETEKCLVSQDVVGGRRSVPLHDELPGNIDEAERGREYH